MLIPERGGGLQVLRVITKEKACRPRDNPRPTHHGSDAQHTLVCARHLKGLPPHARPVRVARVPGPWVTVAEDLLLTWGCQQGSARGFRQRLQVLQRHPLSAWAAGNPGMTTRKLSEESLHQPHTADARNGVGE